MKAHLFKAVFILPVLWVSTGNADDREGAAREFFELKIRPVLTARCATCHGKQKASSNLRVDSRDAMLKGGDIGPAVVPGDPEKSLLLEAVSHAGDIKMPPNGKLSDAEIADFAKWIQEGAVWPSGKAGTAGLLADGANHWAFQPLTPVSPPNDSEGWAESDVDRFIIARLREMKLKPNPLAAKRTLLRRAYFDLIGLGPTPDQTQAFLADESPQAFAKVVDELLESPCYGERWGRHWMDLVHYCDTGGDNADYPVPELYLYRDYIIDSFNADKPFDQFVREQIAGDILAQKGPREKYAEQVIATGYIALAKSYGTLPLEHMHLRIEDSIDTLGSSILGLTLRCARCHDHKIEPVTTKDYYALYAIFAGTKYPWAGSSAFESANSPRINFVPIVPPDEADPRIKHYRDEVAALEVELNAAQAAKGPKE
jgi:cytochrome c553